MDRRARVLIVEREAETRKALGELFDGTGLDWEEAGNGTSGLRRFYRSRPDAVVLGLVLPELSGWQLLARIRELSDAPLLALADEDSETDKVRALRAGADDYVAKPFSKAELLARIEAMLRRRAPEEAPELFADEFLRIDHARHEVDALGTDIELTPTEFRLLAAFARHAGQALTHAQLLRMVWGEGHRDRREVKLYVSYLRRKLRRAGVEPLETVRGIGYRYRPRRLRDAASQ